MIAEVLLVLAGHASSLFPTGPKLNEAITPLLHPGEAQSLESLGLIAFRYRKIKASCNTLSRSPSRYVCAFCATLAHILKDEYESLVIETEAKILKRDAALVANGAFVPLSSVRAVFSEWDAPLAVLSTLMDELEAEKDWKPGPLIDLLVARSRTGVHRIASIISRLSVSVQRVWQIQLTAFLVHGSLSSTDALANSDFSLAQGSIPSCLSPQSRDSIAYIGRAVATVKAAKLQKQPPRSLATKHTRLLESVLPEDQHTFDNVISQIRTDIGEWLWLNVLTRKDVDEAIDALANYLLLRNGEFSLSLIREIERLKIARLTSRSSAVVRDQDLNLAILRASLGTSAQHDPHLSRLRCHLSHGPLHPLLPSLHAADTSKLPQSSNPFESNMLGTPLTVAYNLTWPLDLFLDQNDIATYSALFSLLSSLRKTHTRVHGCWTSLSNAQRMRRRWTGFGEGGTEEDLHARSQMLRCGWGVVRDMNWFLETVLGYMMMDVVDTEYRRLKTLLEKQGSTIEALPHSVGPQTGTLHHHLDFSTLRSIHTTYLARLLEGCLLTNIQLTATVRTILDVCERCVAQVERWGGDVLPPLLGEGSMMAGEENEVGALVKERWQVVAEIDESLRSALEAFYEQLTASIGQPHSGAGDASKSAVFGASMVNQTTTNISRTKGMEVEQSKRHIERLLLKLDFNGELSKARSRKGPDILAGLHA